MKKKLLFVICIAAVASLGFYSITGCSGGGGSGSGSGSESENGTGSGNEQNPANSGTGSNTPADTTAPTITNITPNDRTTFVLVDTNITATFDEPMNVSTINTSTFTVTSSGGNAEGLVTYDPNSRTATFDPTSNLSSFTEYTVTITIGVTDAIGNPLAENRVWVFTTKDIIAPTIDLLSRIPAADATGVDVNTNISASFSEPINCDTVTNETFTVETTSGGNVICSGSTITLDPFDQLPPLALFTVTISRTVTDLAGNQLGTDVIWSFWSRDTMEPALGIRIPDVGATGVSVTARIEVDFNEDLDCPTITEESFSLRDIGADETISGNRICLGRQIVLTPTEPLDYNTEYSVILTSAIRDVAGNPFRAGANWMFTTTRRVLRVDVSSPIDGAGNTWGEAYHSLSAALAAATDGTDIWVAEGTYLPEIPAPPVDPRKATFQLKTGVYLYGAFPNGGGDGTFGARMVNRLRDSTILSGNINNPDDPTDNSYRILEAKATGIVVVDGFVVRDGYANLAEGNHRYGGGFFGNAHGEASFVNVVFANNTAELSGGGIYSDGTLYLTNVIFRGNRSLSENGGGLFKPRGRLVVKNGLFRDNYAAIQGGALFCDFPGTTGDYYYVMNSTFSYNDGGNVVCPTVCFMNMETRNPVVVNSIIYSNTVFGITADNQIGFSKIPGGGGGGILSIHNSLIQNSRHPETREWLITRGRDGGGNIDENPSFVAVGPLLHLQETSPAINTGLDVIAVDLNGDGIFELRTPLPSTDLDGNPRLVGAHVDMGAYEYQPPAR